MRSGWKRFGAFGASVIALIAFVALATRDETRSAGLLAAQIGFIALVSYLVTFLVWPRKTHVSPAHPSRSAQPGPVPDEATPDPDVRPVLVIGDRPAGSRPGSRVHLRDSPTTRAARGRRPGPRGRAEEIRWPTRH